MNNKVKKKHTVTRIIVIAASLLLALAIIGLLLPLIFLPIVDYGDSQLYSKTEMDEVIDIANEIASEHLEIMTKNPYDIMMKIRNAGAIFIGEYSSEPLGDYFAGPNHILPTNGTAKFFSPLSVDDFVKKSSIIAYSREALEEVHEDIEKFATAEQLTAHANSIKVRFEK